MTDLDRFRVDGGCWCPETRTLAQMRIMGHTKSCTEARRGWEQNRRNMSEIAQRRKEDEEAGRLLREAAESVLEREEVEANG